MLGSEITNVSKTESEYRTFEQRMRVSVGMLYRLSGAALLLGGALGVAAQLFHPADPEGLTISMEWAQANQSMHLLIFFVVMLVLVGLPGIYIRQSDKIGFPGLVSFLLLFFGLPLVDLIHSVVDFTIVPSLVAQAPDRAMPVMMAAFEDPSWTLLQMASFPMLGLGAVLFAIMTIRAHVLRGWPAWLLLAAPFLGAIANFIPLPPQIGGASFDGIFFYLALAGFGYALLVDKSNDKN